MTVALFTGWYGMNFVHMPEFDWPWAYPVLVALVAGAIGFELWLFKRKGWL
jgi:magnesium transporter